MMAMTLLATVLIILISMVSAITTAFVIHRQLDNHKCPPCESCNSSQPAQHRAHLSRKDHLRPKLSTRPTARTSSTMLEHAYDEAKIIPYDIAKQRSALREPTQPRPRVAVSPKVVERFPHYIPPYFHEDRNDDK